MRKYEETALNSKDKFVRAMLAYALSLGWFSPMHWFSMTSGYSYMCIMHNSTLDIKAFKKSAKNFFSP